MARTWTKEEHSFLKQLVDNSDKKTWRVFAREMSESFKQPYKAEQVRAYWRNNVRGTETPVTPAYSEEVEILPNGSIKSDKLILLSLEQAKDQQYILEAHGFDHTEWEVVSAKSSQWNHQNKEHGTSTMYSSKVTVKPKKDTNEVDYNYIAKQIADKVVAREPKEYIPVYSDKYLTIPLFDLHFGNNTLEDYDESLGKILSIMNNEYKEILIISGGDQLHNDSHRGMTSSGTVIDKVDMTQAWEDAFDMLDMIIDKALDCAETVRVLYVPGNHDEYSGQTLLKALEKVYRAEDRLTIDSEHKMFKATLLGHNFIGASHGDKSNKGKYPMLLAITFSQLWGKEAVRTRELYVGHLHHELVIDKDGLLIRQAPTRNKADQWHEDNGFTTAHKRFSVVEYDEYEPTAVYYV